MRLEQFLPTKQTLPIKNGNGDLTDVVFHVVSTESKPYRTALKKSTKDLLGKDRDVDQIERSNAELSASCIVGWTGLQTSTGDTLSYTPQCAIELMLNPELTHIREQVDGFTSVRENFFPESQATVGAARSTDDQARHADPQGSDAPQDA